MHNHPKLQRQKREENFLLLLDRAYFLSKMKIFTATVLSQNYHWTDGFSLKNHPLKEAESSINFVSGQKWTKGVGGWNKGYRTGAVSGEVSTWYTVTQHEDTYRSAFHLCPIEVRND